MVFELTQWLNRLLERLQETFGGKILYVGHTGSYARGEATESSDIDVNIVLDTLTTEDLQKYRGMIKEMPFREKACGFICGKEEIKAWPRHELFQFTQGCQVLYGSLDGVIGAPSDNDIRENIRNTAAALYHEACHRYIFCEDILNEAEELKLAYKTTFFLLQEQEYLKTRQYVPTKKELLPRLSGEDRSVLDICVNWDSLKSDREKRPEFYFLLLKNWCSSMLHKFALGN